MVERCNKWAYGYGVMVYVAKVKSSACMLLLLFSPPNSRSVVMPASGAQVKRPLLRMSL